MLTVLVVKILRDIDTGLFFRDGRWVDDWREAQKFDVLDAQDAVKRYHLRHVELYYVYGDSPSTQFDWSIRLDK